MLGYEGSPRNIQHGLVQPGEDIPSFGDHGGNSDNGPLVDYAK